jgi:hypothetical protein
MNRTFWQLVRRYVVLVALMFWQGGFLFYSAVVVPIGQQVLYPPSEQGFITRQVTDYLNLSGAFCLALLAWDLLAGRDPLRPRRWGRWSLMLVMAATLGLLAHLHLRLDAQLDPVQRIVLYDREFYPLHRMYLWTQTVQWGAAMLYVALMVWAWRAEDVNGPSASGNTRSP